MADNPYAAPLSDEAGIPDPVASEIDPQDTVGFGRRAAGRVLDTVASLGCSTMGTVAAMFISHFAGWASVIDPETLERVDSFSLLGFVIGLVGAVIAMATAERIGGASLGKLLLGMRVVSADGRAVGSRGALVRAAAYYVDGLFFGLVGHGAMKSSPFNQRYGDRWGRTVVVRSETVAAEARAPSGLVAVGVLAGLGVSFLSGMLEFASKI